VHTGKNVDTNNKATLEAMESSPLEEQTVLAASASALQEMMASIPKEVIRIRKKRTKMKKIGWIEAKKRGLF
jgi:hypothetical protein